MKISEKVFKQDLTNLKRAVIVFNSLTALLFKTNQNIIFLVVVFPFSKVTFTNKT